MSRALCLIESPFQLLCLREAVDFFQITHITLIIIAEEKSRNMHQLNTSLKKMREAVSGISILFGDKTTVVGKSLEDRIGLYGKLFEKCSLESFEFVFFGDFRAQWQKDIISSLNHPNTWMLDDGTVTLGYLRYHVPLKQVFALPVYGSVQRQKEAENIKARYGMLNRGVPDVGLFTIFNNQVPAGVRFQENALQHLRRTFTKVDTTTDVIIGAKVVERDYSSEEDYHDYLRQIVATCRGNVVYIPHRGQSVKYNNALLEKFPSLTVLYLETSLEQWIASHNLPPQRYHGFMSTAFYVIAKCFPQLQLHCYTPTRRMLDKINTSPAYGTTLFSNAEALVQYYKCLPPSVKRLSTT